MRKFLFWPYQVYMWLFFVPVACLVTVVMSIGAVLSSWLVDPAFGSRVFAVNWARIIAFLTPIRVTVEGAEHAERGRSYVVACNHQSMWDIIVVYGFLDLDLKWVMKKELRKIPAIGVGCEKVGHIFVERSNPKQANEAIAAALERLGDGISILFFPEGTRSLDGRLLRFKTGAFRTAIAQGLPLLPVTVSGTREILPARSLALFPGRARLVVHEPIETRGMTMDQVDELAAEARRRIASALPEHAD